MNPTEETRKAGALTLLDIANNLGLNKTTVSKALNNSSDISRETRERVLAEADRIGYVKHRYKKASSKMSTLIGIVCPEVTSHYYSQSVTFLNSRLQEKGYSMILMLSDFSPEIEKRQLAQLVQMNVAGVIMITEQTDLSPAIHSIRGADAIPMVIMGLNYESRDIDVVSIDEKSGVRAVAEHLIEQGHRRIGFIGDRFVNPRLESLRYFLSVNGIPLPDEYVALSDKRNEECGYEGMRRLLQLKSHPTAVLAGYDSIALGAYRALSEAKLRIPEDIALVGVDDSDFCRYLPCSMTSVNYDIAAECRVAAAILLGRIHDREQKFVQTAAIVPRLVVRESTSGFRTPLPQEKDAGH